ncbi:MAG: CBS domain-containing protein [Saprospiraceae bacterium]|nr:CBS domain-containing protein [Saprospiraceae bacterium]
MTPQVITIKESDTVYKAKDIFTEYPFHHIPVVNDLGKLTGIVSMLDLPSAVKNGLSDVASVMTPEPTVLASDDSIGLAADIFLANSFHAIPIMENGHLIGILTTHDLLRHVFKDQF